MAVDLQRFWNRSLPQTLQTALFLLYLRAFFDLLDMPSNNSRAALARAIKGNFQGNTIWLAIIVLQVVAGFYIANERKLGYKLGLAAAFAPFVFNLWLTWGEDGLNIIEKLCLGPLSSFSVMLWLIFRVALIALLLHPMSKDYQRIWFR
jgi:hypothetical protein